MRSAINYVCGAEMKKRLKTRRAGGDKEPGAEQTGRAAFNKHADDAVIHHVISADLHRSQKSGHALTFAGFHENRGVQIRVCGFRHVLIDGCLSLGLWARLESGAGPRRCCDSSSQNLTSRCFNNCASDVFITLRLRPRRRRKCSTLAGLVTGGGLSTHH